MKRKSLRWQIGLTLPNFYVFRPTCIHIDNLNPETKLSLKCITARLYSHKSIFHLTRSSPLWHTLYCISTGQSNSVVIIIIYNVNKYCTSALQFFLLPLLRSDVSHWDLVVLTPAIKYCLSIKLGHKKLSEVKCLLVLSKSKAPKTLDPALPVMRLNSIINAYVFPTRHLQVGQNII